MKSRRGGDCSFPVPPLFCLFLRSVYCWPLSLHVRLHHLSILLQHCCDPRGLPVRLLESYTYVSNQTPHRLTASKAVIKSCESVLHFHILSPPIRQKPRQTLSQPIGPLTRNPRDITLLISRGPAITADQTNLDQNDSP